MTHDDTGGPGGPAEQPTRREAVDYLLGTALGLSALAALYPAAAYMVPPEGGEAETHSVVLPFPAEDLAPNTGRIFKFGAAPGLVVRTPAGEVRAFSAKCTHLTCVVQYEPDSERILCACHMGWYDLTGRNVAGPPPKPLDTFVVNLRRTPDHGTEIVVSRA